VRGLYITSVDYVYADAGIYTPERVGIAQFCGAAAEGMPREAAANMALRCMVAIEAVIANYPHARLANPGLEQELDSAIQELEKHRRIFAESKEQITTEKVDRKKTRDNARPGTQYSFNPYGHFGGDCGARNTENAANAICTQVVHRNTLEEAGALCDAEVCEW